MPVHLSREQVNRYQHGVSNRVLRPPFHYLIDKVPVDATGWDAPSAASPPVACLLRR